MIKTATDLGVVVAAAVRSLVDGQPDLVVATQALLVGKFVASSAEAEQAKSIINYYRELVPADEAGTNFSSVAKFGQVFPINFPIAVSMVPAYYSRNNAAAAHSDRHIGTLNRRDRFFLKLLSYRVEKGAHTYYMEDRSGKQACFQTAAPTDLAVGDCFAINATVKRHTQSASNTKLTLFRDVEIIENRGKAR